MTPPSDIHPTQKIRIVVVDDSLFMRAAITKLLVRDGRFEVVGEGKTGREAVEAARRLRPDAMTMDLNMPDLDGVEAVREIMRERPVPVVMVSAHTTQGAQATVDALSAGAVDFVAKPSGEVSTDLHRVEAEIVEKLLVAARARPRQPTRVLAATTPLAALPTWSPLGPRVVVIAVSTGGPAALAQVIPALPGDLDCAILVVQHMPPAFTRALAERLDQQSALTVAEAEAGERLHQGRVYLAPGGRHLVVEPTSRIALTDAAPVNGCRPSADVTMRSVAQVLGQRSLGVVMTGMGRDGAEGLRAIREAGGRTFAQDEASSVIYGMPRAAVELGVVDRVVPLDGLAAAIRARW